MSNIQTFDDRFSYANSALVNADIANLTDTQLETLSPEVKEMAAQVRRHSVLLRKKTTVEIYAAITDHADPRIALVLAAARDKQGVKLFNDLETVKAAMFGPATESGTEFLNAANNIFVQGIKRVSASLAASLLIGQLAQIDEQAKHAQTLESQALADLDRIIAVPDLLTSNQAQQAQTAGENQSLYFQDLTLSLDSIIQVDVYLSAAALSGWVSVGTYSGEFNTSNIVVDIADTINTLTLISSRGNILASPILMGKAGLHRIEFNARNRDATISTEVVSIKLRHTKAGTKQELPFKWGVEPEYLAYGLVNSTLITVQQGKTTATSVTSGAQQERSPTVLYFRRAAVADDGIVLDHNGTAIPTAIWANGKLVYRVSPTSDVNTQVEITRTIGSTPAEQEVLDSNRPSQVALALLNSMFTSKAATRALGALIRNDDGSEVGGLVGLELIAFSVTNPQTWIVLDILEVPADIELSVGNLLGPITPFSSKPRSIRVESHYEFRTSQTSVGNPTSTASAIPKLVQLPQSGLLTRTRDLSRPYPTYYSSPPLVGYEHTTPQPY